MIHKMTTKTTRLESGTLRTDVYRDGDHVGVVAQSSDGTFAYDHELTDLGAVTDFSEALAAVQRRANVKS